jgi:hypothetical protein
VSWQILFASTFTTAGRTGALLTGLLLQDRPLPAKLLVLAPTRIMVADAIVLTCNSTCAEYAGQSVASRSSCGSTVTAAAAAPNPVAVDGKVKPH